MRVGAVLTVVLASICTSGGGWAHDWYTDLRQPSTGQPCCSDRHCHRIDDAYVRIAAGQLQILINHSWYEVDPSVILSRRSPDGNVHACWEHNRRGYSASIRILCVILPPET